jgi:hypothetical protein
MKLSIIVVLLFQAIALNARVSRIVIDERSIVADSNSFGTTGPYEKIRGKIYYEIDPSHPANSLIIDLQYSKPNSLGLVEFSGDFILLKPVDMSKANHKLLYGVNNRGNLLILRSLNDADGSNNPQELEHFGNGFLMREGYCVLWSGWNWDVTEGNDRMQFNASVAENDSNMFRQKIVAEIVNSFSIETQKWSELAWGNSRCYPSVNYPDNTNDVLTVRNNPDGKRTIIPNDKWRYAYNENDSIFSDSVCLYIDTGFEPGKIYELVYEVESPKIMGLGLAAVRDILSFFKYETHDLLGNPNPLLHEVRGIKKMPIEFNYIYGISQSGRFIVHMISQGFHIDEKDRMVFDGARIQVAGGGKGGFNFRFAQPTHHPSDLEGNYMPADHPPFNYLATEDANSGGSNDILSISKKKNRIPKIVITNHALEYWTRSASLIHTTLDGKSDASLHNNVRIYMVNGAPHVSPWEREHNIAEHSLSTIELSPINRAFLLILDTWISEGILPPDNKYPTFSNNTLISAKQHKEKMPQIPEMRHPGRNLQPPICDYGAEFWTEGVMTQIPPKVIGRYPTFVPTVDIDGNGVGGIRLIEVAVPLGTYQGFNPRKKEANAPNYLTRFYGSFWAFAYTKKERIANGDPRLSLEERYGSKEVYLERVIKQTKKLLAERFLIKEDADNIIQTTKNICWPPVQLDTKPFWKYQASTSDDK